MVTAFLDKGQRLLEQNTRESVRQAVKLLAGDLYTLKYGANGSQWQEVLQAAQRHPVKNILSEGLQIRHSQQWPRGYPGDAEMLDLIYGLGKTGAKLVTATPRGQYIEEYCFGTLVQVSARRRLKRIANLIDSLAYRDARPPHILSIACGHLREGHISRAVREKRFGRFVALDQDAQSLEVVREEFASLGIETVADSLGAIFKRRIGGKFDFIYAAGLYDYLDDHTASQLTRSAFEMLNPGGCLLLANYTPQTPESAFMEVFMNWPLIYRSEAEMRALPKLLDRHEIKSLRVFPEMVDTEKSCLLYLEIIKNGKNQKKLLHN